jgi:hypothetical protein
MVGVGNGIAHEVLKEDLKNNADLLVDQAGNTLDSTTASETTDFVLGDALDVVAQNFSVSHTHTLCSLSASSIHMRSYSYDKTQNLVTLASFQINLTVTLTWHVLWIDNWVDRITQIQQV